jgi:hypothetical protein
MTSIEVPPAHERLSPIVHGLGCSGEDSAILALEVCKFFISAFARISCPIQAITPCIRVFYTSLKEYWVLQVYFVREVYSGFVVPILSPCQNLGITRVAHALETGLPQYFSNRSSCILPSNRIFPQGKSRLGFPLNHS